MLSLYLDTTHATLMLALADETGLIAQDQNEEADGAYASSTLLPKLTNMLEQTQNQLQDVTQVVVNVGPGSFTGIRTGVSIARLLGQFMPVTLYGVSAFETLAAAEPFRGRTVTVILDAFRQQHSRATLRVDTQGHVTWLSEPAVFANVSLSDSDCEAEVVLVAPTLKGKLPTVSRNLTWLVSGLVFTPAPMAFLCKQQPQVYQTAWQDLRPYYLQQPHVTMSKTVSTCEP